MIHAQAFDLVKRQQNSSEKQLVFFLERQSEPIDNGAKDFQQFSNSVEPLRLVGELEKDVVDGASNEGTEVQEFSVNTVQRCLQEVTLPRILGVEQLQKLQDKAVVDICFCNVSVEILALDKAKEEFVNDLDVRPGNLQDRLVLFRVKSLALRVHGGWNWAEQVLGKHLHDARIHRLRNDLSVVSHIIEKFMECQSLDLLRLHVGTRVVEVKYDITLLDLLHEQVLSPIRRHFVEAWELLQLTVGRDIEPRRVLPPRGLRALQDILRRALV